MTIFDMKNVRRIAAFSDGSRGGNPAGVLVADQLPSDQDMQAIAGAVGYSETAFAAWDGDRWRVRYFAPENEVAFCGHATIALGAVLTEMKGPNTYPLRTNAGDISVTGQTSAAGQSQVQLSSPPTKSKRADPALLQQALYLFDLTPDDLDPQLPPAIANAGNDHLVLALKDRERLSRMEYDFEAGRRLMRDHGLTTINLIKVETPRMFHSRNAFAIGGVTEDPATGAAAAALGGYLRDINWPHEGQIEIAQGVDMGMPSKLNVRIPDDSGTPVHVSGGTRNIDEVNR